LLNAKALEAMSGVASAAPDAAVAVFKKVLRSTRDFVRDIYFSSLLPRNLGSPAKGVINISPLNNVAGRGINRLLCAAMD
jgi:hypothetical protein